ncbi:MULTISPECIES: YktB family protein [Exiguobacterium]|uniref:UPF0637 protein RSA11_15770 n=1 Tax=Exiguobacterium indicum TaxID=296995 RepID=A0AAW3M9V1_9BACL|nr:MULTISPECIES: DUF1054 domain-containing protein [Exiguobacterium]KTR25267.1 hypothetical protein RSA11_15770 [Exiguobacterium indicum]
MTNTFTQYAFDTFHIDGLDSRMHAIRERIQPIFRDIGQEITPDLTVAIEEDMHVHIAQHARRKVNPPQDTWMAFSPDKRGYKKHPHFQVGLFDDHLFIWLAYIYELPNKQHYASKLLNHTDLLTTLPEDFVISYDHMKKDAVPVHETDIHSGLERFHDVKKAEFLVGRHISAQQVSELTREELLDVIRNTYSHLVPLYKTIK